ncbi:MAG: hypothetical protein M3010_09920, partial [Candidatus Dormibacteraeota bacterium]|nr:hypothetical protein [Candidatus Dormibacteraeota bacterium]
MREEDDYSSAVPDTLFAYCDGVRQIDSAYRSGPLARVRGSLDDFLRSCPDYGGSTPRLDGPLSTHLGRSGDLGDWVAAIGTAFFEAGDGRIRHRTHDPDDPGWDGASLWTVDDGNLAAQLYADSAAAEDERRRGATLADQLSRDYSSLDNARNVMAELRQHDGEVIFTTAFFNRLGPQTTLFVERDLAEMTRYARYQRADGPDAFEELLGPFDDAFATATGDSGRTSQD